MSIQDLKHFSAASANDEKHMHLWVKGAAQLMGQFERLATIVAPSHSLKVVSIDNYKTEHSEELANVFAKNRSDKSTQHDYHHLYAFILNALGRDNALNVLEIGLGTNDPNAISTMGPSGRPGASLYAFRDYLSNAKIFGADVDKHILFNAERIRTAYVDQMEPKTLNALPGQFGQQKYHLIVDDGLHSIGANFNTLLFALQHLEDGGWIVIEDIHIVENWRTIDYMLNLNGRYETAMIRAKHKYLYVVRDRN